MAQKRKDWNGLISGFKASDLVFLDESGCNTDTVPKLQLPAHIRRYKTTARLPAFLNASPFQSTPTDENPSNKIHYGQ